MGYPNCMECNKKLGDYRSFLCRPCSKKGERNPAYGKYGTDHHLYKGGYVHKPSGYKFISVKGKKVYEHRHVMEVHLGRKLMTNEIVHHIDGDRLNNNINNLKLFKSISDHLVFEQRDGKDFRTRGKR